MAEASRLKFEDKSDAWIIKLYELWSEEFWAAGFMSPSPDVVQRFYEWLSNWGGDEKPQEDYELEMLRIFRQIDNGEEVI
jgi:hypothetical protein